MAELWSSIEYLYVRMSIIVSFPIAWFSEKMHSILLVCYAVKHSVIFFTHVCYVAHQSYELYGIRLQYSADILAMLNSDMYYIILIN